MSSVVAEPQSPVSRPETPPLRTGDLLSREEYFRRAKAMGGDIRAERLRGVVIKPPAVSVENHGEPQALIIGLLALYASKTPGVLVSGPGTVRLGADSDPEPDVFLRLTPERGGQCIKADDGYVDGPPELCMEIANSSAGTDLFLKRDLYEEHGVREYVVWLPAADRAVIHRLRDGKFNRQTIEASDPAPVFDSEVFPGLRIDFGRLAASDLAGAFEALQTALETPEHTAFARAT